MARTSHMTIILVLIIHSYNNENMKHTIEAGLVTLSLSLFDASTAGNIREKD